MLACVVTVRASQLIRQPPAHRLSLDQVNAVWRPYVSLFPFDLCLCLAAAELVRGKAVFNNLRIMEVSSKHMNKCFRVHICFVCVSVCRRSNALVLQVVIEPKIRCGVQPCVSHPVRVFAKKMTGKQHTSSAAAAAGAASALTKRGADGIASLLLRY